MALLKFHMKNSVLENTKLNGMKFADKLEYLYAGRWMDINNEELLPNRLGSLVLPWHALGSGWWID